MASSWVSFSLARLRPRTWVVLGETGEYTKDRVFPRLLGVVSGPSDSEGLLECLASDPEFRLLVELGLHAPCVVRPPGADGIGDSGVGGGLTSRAASRGVAESAVGPSEPFPLRASTTPRV